MSSYPVVYSNLDNVFNTRDLGGYASLLFPGKRVKLAQLIRSSSVANASDHDLAVISSALGKQMLVIDMRTEEEIQQAGIAELVKEQFTLDVKWTMNFQVEKEGGKGQGCSRYLLCPLITRSESIKYLFAQLSLDEKMKFFWFMMICRKNVAMTIVLKKLWINGLSGLYRFILISGKARIAIVLKEIADSSSPVLFNCSWGKDRTGIIAALLLKILGVSENDIARDFELTEKLIPKEMLQDRIPNTFRIVVFKDAEERQRILNEITSSPKKAILDVFEMLKNEFGSMENYLDEIGFGRSWRLKIQEKYLTDA